MEAPVNSVVNIHQITDISFNGTRLS